MPKLLYAGVIAASAVAAGAAHAQEFTALNTPAPQTGNQPYGGSLGEDFSVDAAAGIIVTGLGAFDSNQDGIFQDVGSGEIVPGSIVVQIYDNITQALVPGLQASVTTANSTLNGGYRFTDIPDVLLAPGSYRVVASGYNGAELNGNAGIGPPPATGDTGGGLISFPTTGSGSGNSYFGAANVYPTSQDGGPINRYLAGSFTFTAVPEPSAIGALALGGLGLLARRRRA